MAGFEESTSGLATTGDFVINPWGLRKVYNLLGDVDKDLRRKYVHEIASKVKEISEAGKSRAEATPRINRHGQHFPDEIKLKKSGSLKKMGLRSKGGLFGYSLYSGDPASTILDLAAKSHTAQGAALIATLDKRYGAAPRFLFGAYIERRGALKREIEEILERYIQEANRRIEHAAATGEATGRV